MWHLRKNEPRRTAVAGATRERNSCAVRRPDRRYVLAGGRREIDQRCVLGRKNSDEGVIPSGGNKRKSRSIRRPDQSAVLAAIEEQVFRLTAVEGRDPDVTILGICELSASENQGLPSVINFNRRAAIRRQGPNRGGRLRRRGIRVGRKIAFGGPVGIVIAAQHEDQPRAVR